MVSHKPPGPPHPAHWVLVVPPLFEDLNKSRRTLSLLGRTLAEQGLGCLLPDLYGTGDSEGDVSAATWDTWIADLTRTHAWLLQEGARRVDLLALRGGALLGWDWLAGATAEIPVFILWHPVINGRQAVQHLLRLHLAGGLLGREGSESVASLRAGLAQTGWIEIAGYRLSAELVASLEGSALGAPGPRRIGRVEWYQVVSAPGQVIPPSVDQCAQTWNEAGIPTGVRAIEGDTFWASQEIVEGTSLVAATVRSLLEAGTDDGRT